MILGEVRRPPGRARVREGHEARVAGVGEVVLVLPVGHERPLVVAVAVAVGAAWPFSAMYAYRSLGDCGESAYSSASPENWDEPPAAAAA